MELRFDEWKAPHVHADGAQQVCFDAPQTHAREDACTFGPTEAFRQRAPGVDEILSQPRSCRRQDLRRSVAA